MLVGEKQCRGARCQGWACGGDGVGCDCLRNLGVCVGFSIGLPHAALDFAHASRRQGRKHSLCLSAHSEAPRLKPHSSNIPQFPHTTLATPRRVMRYETSSSTTTIDSQPTPPPPRLLLLLLFTVFLFMYCRELIY